MKHALVGTLFLVALGVPVSRRADARHKKADPTEAAAKTDPSKMTEAQRKSSAQKLVAEARSLFDKGDFAPAAAKFEEAYRLFPVPKMLYNIGITYEALKKPDLAVCTLERFVAEAPESDPALITESKGKIELLKPSVGRVEVTAPAGAVLFVDGEERAVAPEKGALCVENGKRRVVALVAGVAPVGIDLDVTATYALKVALDPATNTAKLLNPPEVKTAEPPKPPQPPATPVYKRWWLWTAVGGVAVAGAAVGIGLALRPTNVMAPPAEYGPYKVFP